MVFNNNDVTLHIYIYFVFETEDLVVKPES